MADLRSAIEEGRYDAAIALIQGGADVGWADEDRWTALHLAAVHAHPRLVSLLLQHGVPVDAEDRMKRTPLLDAIGWPSSPSQEEDRLECAKVLLQAGANIRHCDVYGNNALHYAFRKRYLSIAQHLLTVDPSLCLVKNWAGKAALTLQQAAKWGHPAIISLLLQHGARVDDQDNQKRSPLLLAIGWKSSPSLEEDSDSSLSLEEDSDSSPSLKEDSDSSSSLEEDSDSSPSEEDRLECAKVLLQAGANIRHCDKNGNNALHYATSSCSLSIAQHLLTVDPSLCLVKNSQGEAALTLQQAAEWGHPAIISILLQHGARVDEEDNEKRTPLLQAIRLGSSSFDEKDRLECVKILLGRGANIRHCDKLSNNALHYATSSRQLSIVQHLLTVDPSLCLVKNSDERTALHVAADNAQPAIISLLLQHGAQIEDEDNQKRTPLLRAIEGPLLLLAIGWRPSPSEEEARLECVQVLLQAGANIHHCDKDGDNAIHYATSSRYLSIAQHLLTVDPSLCLVKNFAEETALHVAADKAQPAIISLLLQHGAEVDEEDWWKRTPLLRALRWKSSPSEEEARLECVKLLLQARANIRHCDEDGNNALHFAIRRGYLSIVEHLLEKDSSPAFVDNQDREKRTPLLCAMARQSLFSGEPERLRCVELLLGKGANVDQNALDYAISSRYTSIVGYLLPKYSPFADKGDMEEFVKRVTLVFNNEKALLDVVTDRDLRKLVPAFISSLVSIDVKNSEGKMPYELVEDEDLKTLLCPHYEKNHRYTVDRGLGGGTFGVVEEVHDRDGKAFARKQINIANTSIKRLAIEVNAMKRMDHPNVVELREFWRESKELFIIMELCEGTLEEWLSRLPSLKERDSQKSTIRKLFVDISGGVAYIHSQNLIHRDLKPNNILLNGSGNSVVAKVTDLGLCAPTRNQEAPSDRALLNESGGDLGLSVLTENQYSPSDRALLNETGSSLVAKMGSLSPSVLTGNQDYLSYHTKSIGNKAYRAPEVHSYDREAKYSRKVDVYAMGLIWVEMLIPIANPEKSRIFTSLKNGEFYSLKNRLEKYPEEFKMIKRMLDYFPEKRPTSAEVFECAKAIQEKTDCAVEVSAPEPFRLSEEERELLL
ncbi:unnamed protein product [Cyprideis torosa]|uniref:Uncharacterized protein n=1 Tax=Cyprideis torosa TaxID=163714 RepID=A0A7R8WMT0_9CRUS|nr:unnamed protein product [Cyprideis torosa]CAG0905563.1 unnamed protein product [Cyprideis torosa]